MSLQLQLKVLWNENFLGLSINQTSLKSAIPITSYYLWPKTDAWQQLKFELDSKPWLSEQEKIKVLNHTAEIMNYWRKNRGKKSLKTLSEDFSELEFIGLVQ